MNGVFDQRLQQQGRQWRVEWQTVVQLPVHPQPLAHAQLFDGEVAAGEFDLFPQRDALQTSERGTQQIGQVEHHLLGPVGLGADQAGDGVEGVEQKVGVDARLQGPKAGTGFGLDILFPLVLDVEVAQGDQSNDAADREVAGDEGNRRRRQGGEVETWSQQPPAERREQQGDQLGQSERGEGGGGDLKSGQPEAAKAEHRHGAQSDPLHEQRGERQFEPEFDGAVRFGQSQDEGEQLGEDDRQEHRPISTEVGQKARRMGWVGMTV